MVAQELRHRQHGVAGTGNPDACTSPPGSLAGPVISWTVRAMLAVNSPETTLHPGQGAPKGLWEACAGPCIGSVLWMSLCSGDCKEMPTVLGSWRQPPHALSQASQAPAGDHQGPPGPIGTLQQGDGRPAGRPSWSRQNEAKLPEGKRTLGALTAHWCKPSPKCLDSLQSPRQ